MPAEIAGSDVKSLVALLGIEPGFLDEFHFDDPHTLAAMDAVLYGGDRRKSDSMFHVLPMSYHGRIDTEPVPIDLWTIEWQCQRLSASLESRR